MNEKGHAPSHPLSAPPRRGNATCGCVGRDGRFQPLFSIDINNEKSGFSVVQCLIADVLPCRDEAPRR
jgi:hypothetical protein